MDAQSRNNAKQALSSLKMEIASELGYNYNNITDKIESNAPQNTLIGHAKNVLAGEQVGGQMSKKLVEMGEQMLIDNYNKDK
ncbi:small, acid-soluble spore protein, alpha/beta type [Romboutsia sp.]|uniref:small, acid-soluble spore protein, alpha/beta type n=1 Tax=Romboutsia sp. TaxID=1965302 RepID=UPI003F325691